MGMVWERIWNWSGLEISTDRIFGWNTMCIYVYTQSNYMYIACMLALLASNVIFYCMAVLLSCNLYILYTLYARVAGKQTIWACMSALLTSNAISACMPVLLASKLYGLVCQRCWQARYCGLYASVAGKQAILACMPALLASKILWLVCQRCWQASHMCLYAHTHTIKT